MMPPCARPPPSFYPFSSFSLGLRLGSVLSFFSAPSVLSLSARRLSQLRWYPLLLSSAVAGLPCVSSSLADYPSVKLTSWAPQGLMDLVDAFWIVYSMCRARLIDKISSIWVRLICMTRNWANGNEVHLFDEILVVGREGPLNHQYRARCLLIWW